MQARSVRNQFTAGSNDACFVKYMWDYRYIQTDTLKIKGAFQTTNGRLNDNEKTQRKTKSNLSSFSFTYFS